jgi:hypothetical protein
VAALTITTSGANTSRVANPHPNPGVYQESSVDHISPASCCRNCWKIANQRPNHCNLPALRRTPMRSLTDEAVSLIQDVIAEARNCSLILDARQEGLASAGNVHCAEGTAGVDEAVAPTRGVAVIASDLPGVAGRERKVDRGKHASLEQKAMESRW